MIYTIRRFLVSRSDRADYVRWTEESLWPEGREGREGLPTALGLWLVGLGGEERFLQLLRYDNMAHWEATRGWAAPKERSAMVRESDSVGLRPLSRRQPGMPSPKSTQGVYTLQTSRVERRDVARYGEATEGSLWPWLDAQGVAPVGQWVSQFGEGSRIYTLVRYQDLGQWDALTIPSTAESAATGQQLLRAATEARDTMDSLTLDESLVVLRPQSRMLP